MSSSQADRYLVARYQTASQRERARVRARTHEQGARASGCISNLLSQEAFNFLIGGVFLPYFRTQFLFQILRMPMIRSEAYLVSTRTFISDIKKGVRARLSAKIEI
jgi:hypothetical protein